jgi:hypothetical protein
MLHKDYDRKGSIAKQQQQDSGRDPQEAWRQDKLIDGKPPVVNTSNSGSNCKQL